MCTSYSTLFSADEYLRGPGPSAHHHTNAGFDTMQSSCRRQTVIGVNGFRHPFGFERMERSAHTISSATLSLPTSRVYPPLQPRPPAPSFSHSDAAFLRTKRLSRTNWTTGLGDLQLPGHLPSLGHQPPPFLSLSPQPNHRLFLTPPFFPLPPHRSRTRSEDGCTVRNQQTLLFLAKHPNCGSSIMGQGYSQPRESVQAS